MRRKLILIALALATTAFAQFAINYHDKEGNFAAVGPGGGSVNYRVNGPTRLTLKGSASEKAKISSKAQGISITAASVVAEVVTAGNRNRIQSVQATGGVDVVKDVGQNGTHQVTEIHASDANYAAGSTEGKLSLGGAVTIRSKDDAKRQTSVVTGNDGVVMVDPDAKGQTAVRTATLSGPVKVDVLQEPQADKPQAHYVATGDRLVYNNVSKPTTLTLSGNVKVTGASNFIGDTSGVDQAVITLNEKGEMTEVNMTGGPATTHIRKVGSKG